jgi:uncharacterized membrane protein YhaH (DUF805 family)
MGLWATLFGFAGRTRRTIWWLAGLGAGLVLGTAGAITAAVAIVTGAFGAHDLGLVRDSVTRSLLIWLAPLELAGLWIGLALNVKRAHDRGYPWIAVLIGFVPVVGPLWVLIDLGLIDGTPGPNAYGPSPKGLGQQVTTPLVDAF